MSTLPGTLRIRVTEREPVAQVNVPRPCPDGIEFVVFQLDADGYVMLPLDPRQRAVPLDPAAHLFRVTCTVHDPDPSGQQFTLPSWIPGSYMIREFARNIVELQAESADHPVECSKVDKATWRCAPVAAPLTLSYDVYAWDLSVRAAHLDTTHGYFNGTSVFLAASGREKLSAWFRPFTRKVASVSPIRSMLPARIRRSESPVSNSANLMLDEPPLMVRTHALACFTAAIGFE